MESVPRSDWSEQIPSNRRVPSGQRLGTPHSQSEGQQRSSACLSADRERLVDGYAVTVSGSWNVHLWPQKNAPLLSRPCGMRRHDVGSDAKRASNDDALNEIAHAGRYEGDRYDAEETDR